MPDRIVAKGELRLMVKYQVDGNSGRPRRTLCRIVVIKRQFVFFEKRCSSGYGKWRRVHLVLVCDSQCLKRKCEGVIPPAPG